METELEKKIFINSIIGTLVCLGIERLSEQANNSDHNKIIFPSSSYPIDILTFHKKENFISCSYSVGVKNGSLPDKDGAFFDPKDIEKREIGVSLELCEIMEMLEEIIKK